MHRQKQSIRDRNLWASGGISGETLSEAEKDGENIKQRRCCNHLNIENSITAISNTVMVVADWIVSESGNECLHGCFSDISTDTV